MEGEKSQAATDDLGKTMALAFSRATVAPMAAFPKAPAGSPHTRRPLDRTGAPHLKSSRISRLSAWKGMFRTRILEVVCFLGTCFFRVDVRAGLQGGERGWVTWMSAAAAPSQTWCSSAAQVGEQGA